MPNFDPLFFFNKIGTFSRSRNFILLDRDGIINKVPTENEKISCVDNLSYTSNFRQFMGLFSHTNFRFAIVTNQPDLDRGIIDPVDYETICSKIVLDFPEVEAIITCPHIIASGCACRKPGPGMLNFLINHYKIDLKGSWMVGDRWVDVEAGNLSGLNTALLETENSMQIVGGEKSPLIGEYSFQSTSLIAIGKTILDRHSILESIR